MRWVPTSTAGVFTGVMPVSVVALSALALGEALTWSHFVGIVCVLGAIALTVVEPPAARSRRLFGSEATPADG